jgi:hypothetical protein
MTTPARHPAGELLAALTHYIDSISARLQQSGHGTPNPRALRIGRGIDLPVLAAKSGISKATI